MSADARARLTGWAERMIIRACRSLPAGLREDRVAEWSAETSAVFHDPDVRSAWRRAARSARFTLGFARAVRYTRPVGAEDVATAVSFEVAFALGWIFGVHMSGQGLGPSRAWRLWIGLSILNRENVRILLTKGWRQPWSADLAAATGFVFGLATPRNTENAQTLRYRTVLFGREQPRAIGPRAVTGFAFDLATRIPAARAELTRREAE